MQTPNCWKYLYSCSNTLSFITLLSLNKSFEPSVSSAEWVHGGGQSTNHRPHTHTHTPSSHPGSDVNCTAYNTPGETLDFHTVLVHRWINQWIGWTLFTAFLNMSLVLFTSPFNASSIPMRSQPDLWQRQIIQPSHVQSWFASKNPLQVGLIRVWLLARPIRPPPLREKPTISATVIVELRGGRPVSQISKPSKL